jgi:hypothetical protein
MSRHYASSKLFVWLRHKLGVNKPAALPFGQWAVWEKDLRSRRPVTYFLTETLPDWLEKPGDWLVDPIDNAIYYIRRRFIIRSHLIDTKLSKGKYHSADQKMLYGMFNELVDFIEIEKAWMCVRWEDKEHQKKYNIPWGYSNWYLRWKPWRSVQAGLDHLKWEMGLDDHTDQSQAQQAAEQLLLYTWWKEIRSKRNDMDSWEESGLREFCDQMDKKYGTNSWGVFAARKNSMTPAEQATYQQLSDLMNATEQRWEQEDEDMMIRLIKIRRGLWT